MKIDDSKLFNLHNVFVCMVDFGCLVFHLKDGQSITKHYRLKASNYGIYHKFTFAMPRSLWKAISKFDCIGNFIHLWSNVSDQLLINIYFIRRMMIVHVYAGLFFMCILQSEQCTNEKIIPIKALMENDRIFFVAVCITKSHDKNKKNVEEFQMHFLCIFINLHISGIKLYCTVQFYR